MAATVIHGQFIRFASESEKVKAGIELQIQPYEGDGLSLNSPDAEMTKKMKFDGKDYPDLDPNGDTGSVSSGRRVNERSLEITDKFKGKLRAPGRSSFLRISRP